jgi:MOSC domain-containing protein YiiM
MKQGWYANQTDKKHRGGPDEAIHHYAFEHYEYW